MIGNDGRVYEARGWNKVGAHTKGYNRCSLGLAFIGKKSTLTTVTRLIRSLCRFFFLIFPMEILKSFQNPIFVRGSYL